MSTTGLRAFDNAIEKTHIWLNALMEELHWEDRHKAYMALRTTLHTLRDRLTVEEVAHLGAQLPLLIRGFYYEGWNPTGKPLKIRHREEFLTPISDYFSQTGGSVDPERIARAVFKVLSQQISKGEIEDIMSVLPGDLRELWPESAQA